MAQHDYIIADQPGLAFRTDLNEALAAIVSQNSGAAEPVQTFAFQWWADTTTGVLKQRNAGNNGWVGILNLSTGSPINASIEVSSVPENFAGSEIIVTQPHLRKMVWSAAQNKYVRAPWHQPCQLFFSYDNPSTIPGALPVRGDVSWNQSDFPDVVERLSLSGTGTFTLVEARGEGVRVLDNGRGIDAGRALRSAQLDAFQGFHIGNSDGILGKFDLNASSGGTAIGGMRPGTTDYARPISDGVNGTPRIASETRMRNIAFPLWMTI